MNTNLNEGRVTERPGRRLDEIALALVLIMTGALWLAPKAMFPEGTWLAAAGLILLGLNGARRLRGLKTSGFGLVLGLIALAAGIGRILGQELPVIPILLIVFGAGLIVRTAARGQKGSAGTPDAS